MHLRSLPAPDALHIELPESAVALIVDDGTALAPATATRLQEMGWSVVLLRRPDAEAVVGEDDAGSLPAIKLGDLQEATVVEALDAVQDTYGAIAACVVLTPQGVVSEGADVLNGLGERDVVRVPFLLAKHLQVALQAAAETDWAGFFIVTRMDGALGLTGDLGQTPAASGLTGLAKTLRLEWPAVACRAVDVAPTLGPDVAAERIVGEMMDPNRLLAEVGWDVEGRRVSVVAP